MLRYLRVTALLRATIACESTALQPHSEHHDKKGHPFAIGPTSVMSWEEARSTTSSW